MRESVVTFLDFWYPGIVVSNESSTVVGSRDLAAVELPENAYAFRFADRTEVTTDDGEVIVGKRRNLSPMYYPGGVIFDIDQVALLPDTKILQSNMLVNKWDKVIRTCSGNFQPFNDTDVVISVDALASAVC